MSLEAYLEDAGFEVAVPFPSCADALQWLEHNTSQVPMIAGREGGPSSDMQRYEG